MTGPPLPEPMKSSRTAEHFITMPVATPKLLVEQNQQRVALLICSAGVNTLAIALTAGGSLIPGCPLSISPSNPFVISRALHGALATCAIFGQDAIGNTAYVVEVLSDAT